MTRFRSLNACTVATVVIISLPPCVLSLISYSGTRTPFITAADASSMIQPPTPRVLSGMAVMLDDCDRSIIVTSESTFQRVG
ncbi:hypothetical protein AB1N83_003381 [Pleurotus pulmonarius]